MHTADRNKEEKLEERGVVGVANTVIDPWTMVIHLLNTSNGKQTPYYYTVCKAKAIQLLLHIHVHYTCTYMYM